MATAKTYTPTFTWSDNADPPTEANIQARYCVSGKICFIYARYEITDLGNPGSNGSLRISFPEGIIPIVSTSSLISEYQTVSDLPETLGIRVSADKNMELATGIGGGYSGPYVPTGYQGFSIFFMFLLSYYSDPRIISRIFHHTIPSFCIFDPGLFGHLPWKSHLFFLFQ